MLNTFSFDYFGSPITAKSLGTEFIPSLKETLTAHCLPITKDGDIVAINIIGRGTDIPGGHIEDGETAVEAMIRETHEEAQITVTNPILVDVWHLSSSNDQLGLTEKPYLLLYAAEVTSIQDFIPNKEASERLILGPNEFIARYFGDKLQARAIVNRVFATL